MAKIHMVLQGKGGVGKSMIAATIAQYKLGKGQKPLCMSVVTRFDVPMFTYGDGRPWRAVCKNAVGRMPTALLY